MKDRKPKFVHTFDNSKPTKEAQLKAICDLALLLFLGFIWDIRIVIN